MIKKAVFPVAGLGTRFLPVTKATPKEMLPIVDKPLIQYAVEEAVKVGVTDIIFVTSSTKRAIEDHFDSNFELEERLRQQEKTQLLEIVKNILPPHVKCIYTRQAEQLGLGHAILCAESIVGQEPFFVLLADDLLAESTPCLETMLEHFHKVRSSILAVEKIKPVDSDKYGVIAIKEEWQQKLVAISGIVEKPKPSLAPSGFGVIGRYILTPTIFSLLRNLEIGVGRELQLTDAIAQLLTKEPVYAMELESTRYDCGSKLGFLQATVAFGLKHPEIAQQFKTFLQSYSEKIL